MQTPCTQSYHSIPSLILLRPLRFLLSAFLDPLKYVFPILVKLQFRNYDLARCYTQRHVRPI